MDSIKAMGSEQISYGVWMGAGCRLQRRGSMTNPGEKILIKGKKGNIQSNRKKLGLYFSSVSRSKQENVKRGVLRLFYNSLS